MTEPYLAHENQELHWTVMATASASVRFICGTQEEHKQREERISSFLRMEDTILDSSCFESPALALCQQRYDGARGRIDEDRKLRLDPGPAEDHNKLGFTLQLVPFFTRAPQQDGCSGGRQGSPLHQHTGTSCFPRRTGSSMRR